jgi:hypothetical protein
VVSIISNEGDPSKSKSKYTLLPDYHWFKADQHLCFQSGSLNHKQLIFGSRTPDPFNELLFGDFISEKTSAKEILILGLGEPVLQLSLGLLQRGKSVKLFEDLFAHLDSREELLIPRKIGVKGGWIILSRDKVGETHLSRFHKKEPEESLTAACA